MTQLTPNNLLEQRPYLIIMHPAHLAFNRHLPFTKLSTFLELLEGLEVEQRAKLMPMLYTHFGILDLTNPADPRPRKDSPEAFAEFKEKCRAISSQLVLDRVLVAGLAQILLDYVFHLGDSTSIESIRSSARSLHDCVEKNLTNSSTTIWEETGFSEWMKNHLENLPVQAEEFYAIYVYFCENVLARLYETHPLE